MKDINRKKNYPVHIVDCCTFKKPSYSRIGNT